MEENGDKGKVTMQDDELGSLLESYRDLPDPRSERNQDHPLISSVFIAICGTISGADNWVDIEAYGKAKADWLKTLVPLPHGIPSHDTFGRVFRFINPQAFQERFLEWVRQIGQGPAGEVIAMDGKQMRRSKDGPAGKEGLYMVSAWAADRGIVLGQRRVDEKSNEITAIPELLDVLALERVMHFRSQFLREWDINSANKGRLGAKYEPKCELRSIVNLRQLQIEKLVHNRL